MLPELKTALQLERGLDRLGWGIVLCLSFLVIPTVILLVYCLEGQLSISRYITQAWQEGFWQ